MSAVELIAMGVGVLAVFAVAGFSMRWSRRSRAGEHERIRGFNALLERVAKSRSLSFEVPPEHMHPVVGSCPGYGTLSGTIDGLEVSLGVPSDMHADTPRHDRIELILSSSSPWPVKAHGSWSRGKGPQDIGRAFTSLTEAAELLEVSATQIRVTPHCTPSGSEQSVMQWLFIRDEELLGFVDLAMKACVELREY